MCVNILFFIKQFVHYFYEFIITLMNCEKLQEINTKCINVLNNNFLSRTNQSIKVKKKPKGILMNRFPYSFIFCFVLCFIHIDIIIFLNNKHLLEILIFLS